MMTESSNRIIAANANDVAVVSARNQPFSAGVSKATPRDKPARPPTAANKPTTITSPSPDISTRVSTTLAFTLSPTVLRSQADTSRRRNPATPTAARTVTVPTATSTAGTDKPLINGSCPAY